MYVADAKKRPVLMKKRVTYEILVDREPDPGKWESVGTFKTRLGDIEAERIAHRRLSKLEPMTTYNTAAPFRIVIVPEGLAGQVKDWAV